MSNRSTATSTAAHPAAPTRPHGPRPHRTRTGAIGVVAALVASALVGVLGDPVVELASAAGSPNIVLTKSAPAEVLIGAPAEVSLRACNPSTEPDGYHLSLRDIVPSSLTLVSATPAPTRSVFNQPNLGETTLIWENVSDLPSGSCTTITYSLDTNPDLNLATNQVGSTFATTAGAYLNATPGAIPDFNANGIPTTDITGNDTDLPPATTLRAFFAESDAGDADEHGLLRGVHGDRATTYTVRVRNNPDAATNDLTLVDVLPASLEFLGCASYPAAGYTAGTDNTVDAPTNETPGLQPEEYVGSGRLALGAAAPTCIEPTTVETLGGGATRLTWTSADLGSVADLAPGATLEIGYLAGIPLRANTDTWPNGKPTNASLGQGRNLDNNSGDPTSETTTEPSLTNVLTTTGTYIGPSTAGTNPTIADSATVTVRAEDLVVRTTMTGQVIQGSVVTTTLQISAGEYRDVRELVVTDTLGDGLCPLAVVAVSGDADCGAGADPTIDAGSGPTAAPFGSATENVDGTWTLVWDDVLAELASLAHDGVVTISFESRVRTASQEGFAPQPDGAIRALDELTHTVAVAGPDDRRSEIDPVVGDPEPDGDADADESTATISGVGPSLDQRVSVRTGVLATPGLSDAGTGNPGDVGDACRDAIGFTWVDGDPTGVGGFGPGDHVCFDLRATFPAGVQADDVQIVDLLPTTFDIVAGSARRVTGGGSPDTLPGSVVAIDTAPANDAVTFTVGTAGEVPADPGGQTFHWTIAARLRGPALGAAGDVSTNLVRLTAGNTAGELSMWHDRSAAIWTEPQVRLDATNDASGDLDAGDTVESTILVWNTGNVAAVDAEVWARLPTGIGCADVDASTPTADCAAGVLVWDAADIPTVAGSTSLGTAPVTLSYTVDLPASVDPDRTYTDTVGVRHYGSATNASDSPQVYVPASNVDPSATSNTDAAHDTTTFSIHAASVAKTQQSGVGDGASNPANAVPSTADETVTIGETITYTITATIPEGTSVVDARFTDQLDADLVLHATPTWVVDGTPNDPAWTLDAGSPAVGTNGTVRLERLGTHTNAAGTGDDVVVLTIVARVSDAVGTTAGDTIPNMTTFSYLPDAALGGTRTTLTSTTVTGVVREPNPTVTKGENDADDLVAPNDTLTYTITIANAGGSNPVRAHDLVVVDTLPAGLTVVNGGVPVADGGSVAPDGGTWDATARTITWDAITTPGSLTSVAAAGLATLTYDVVVDDPTASGSTFANSVTVTASSMAGSTVGERTTYGAGATDSVSAAGVTITGSVGPSAATVGDVVTVTVEATVPVGVTAYDLTVLDTVGDGLDLVGFGTIAYTGTSTGCPSLAGAQPIADQTDNPNGSTTIGFWIDDLAAPPTNSCVVAITYTARLDSTYEPEATPVAHGQGLANSATVHWNGTSLLAAAPPSLPSPGSFVRAAGPAAATVTVREPTLVIDHDVSQTGCDQTPGNSGDTDTCHTDIGAEYTYTLRISNTSSTWPAHDVVVTVAADTDLVNVSVPGSAGAVTVVDDGAPTLEWLISTIPANGQVTITYTADLAAPSTLTDGHQVIDTADVAEYFAQPVATRTADPASEWRTYGGGGAGGDVAADTVTMTVGFPHVTVATSAIDDATDARVGVAFTWQIVATNQAAEPTAPAFGIDLDDTLPAGWVYVAGSATATTPYGSAPVEPVCTPSCATPGATLRWTDVVSGGAQPVNPGATVTITFDAVPQSSLHTVGTTGTFDHTNVAGVADVADVTGATTNLDGAYAGADDDATARIRRTDLTVATSVTAGPYSFGSEVNWTISVTNTGPDTATGVTVADLLPASLVYVSLISVTQGTHDAGTGVWTVGSLAAGTTRTLVIRTRLNQIGPITHRAEVDVAHQWDVDSTPAAQAFVADEDDDDTIMIVATSTSLGDLVWYDVDGDGVADVGEPGIPGVRVLLESAGLDEVFGTTDDFHGPDGTAGGGDDIDVTETLTNATGFYGFADLPIGDFRVVIDTTSLPAGTINTADDDGDLDDESGIVTLTSSTGYLGADFGYTGTGSLGDTVWLDLDGSGGATRQPGEPGLGDIDVTLVWAGFDGDLGTAGDNVTYPVALTDGDGEYGFALLPAGPYRVTLDPADLPAGVIPTHDPDGTATAATAVVSLTAAEQRTDVDLSYAGTGSIGDRVWYDRDGDGVFDASLAGGGETPIAAAEITVTWLGPDGATGGGDDASVVTTTGPGGTYLVDHLPAGQYTVAVDPADVAAGMVPTHDLDGTASAHGSSVALAAGQDRTDVDFGYRGVASVGDQVWFDLDGDGDDAPGADDPGLGGVVTTVVWAGPDLTLGTGDDVTVTTATDASGDYLVTHLPFGPVRVGVDTSALHGFVATHDGDGLGTLHTVEVVLAPDDGGTADVDEANRRDGDFAFTGTGSIGDRVWADADADGVVDPGEAGLVDVDVALTWSGLDGVAATPDDLALVARTDADGRYLAERLPAGAHLVVVDTADLAAGMVNVADPDPMRDSRTATTLVAGQDRTDVDFGYQLQADLALRVSHASRFEVGHHGVYTLAVTNAGPAAALAPRIVDELPAGLTFVSGISTTGISATASVCASVGQTVTCDLPTMAAGTTSTIAVTVAVGRAAAPSVVNRVTVSSATFDPVPGNDSDTDPTEVPLADLAISKRLDGSLIANQTAHYVVDVANLGPSASGGTLVVTDELPTGLTYIDAVSAGATCSASGQVVTCRSAATVAAGTAIVIDVRVRVTAAAGTEVVNTAQVVLEPNVGSSPPTDPLASNNVSSTPVTIVSAGLPTTGFDLLRRWLPYAAWAVGSGLLVLAIARRRRHLPG